MNNIGNENPEQDPGKDPRNLFHQILANLNEMKGSQEHLEEYHFTMGTFFAAFFRGMVQRGIPPKHAAFILSARGLSHGAPPSPLFPPGGLSEEELGGMDIDEEYPPDLDLGEDNEGGLGPSTPPWS